MSRDAKLADVTRKGGPRCSVKNCGRVATEERNGKRYCKVHAKTLEALDDLIKKEPNE